MTNYYLLFSFLIRLTAFRFWFLKNKIVLCFLTILMVASPLWMSGFVGALGESKTLLRVRIGFSSYGVTTWPLFLHVVDMGTVGSSA